MDLKNIDTVSLRSSLNNCLNNIKYDNSENIIVGLTDDIWEGKSKRNLTDALNKLINTNYKELENKINDYLNVVSQIERYQSLNTSLEELEQQKSSKQSSLNSSSNSNTDNGTLKSEISSLTTQINEIKEEMSGIERSISI